MADAEAEEVLGCCEPPSSHLCMDSRALTGLLARILSISDITAGVNLETNCKESHEENILYHKRWLHK